MTKPATSSGSDATRNGSRRPNRDCVRSLQPPTTGSLTASHSFARPNNQPTIAGVSSRTSVAYLRK